MAGSLSLYAADLAIDIVRGSTHIALFAANPITAGDQDDEQANANGYSRQAITWTDTGDEDDDNTAEILFTASGAGWTGPWYVVGLDSGTYGAGNIIWVAVDGSGDPVTTTVTSLADGDSLRFAAAAIAAMAGLGGTPP